MISESYRPQVLDEVFGNDDAKKSLTTYLNNNTPGQAVLLVGTPGIGKTTIALASARTLQYEPLEVNASRTLRSHADVQSLRDSCMAPFSFASLTKYDVPRKTCVILDEIDGSDPHAQRKILDWIQDESRRVPILMTANEEPIIFKRAKKHVLTIRCLPSSATVLFQHMKPGIPLAEFQTLAKECLHDVRRILNRMQYGRSDTLQTCALTGDLFKDLHLQRETFYKTDPIQVAIESTCSG